MARAALPCPAHPPANRASRAPAAAARPAPGRRRAQDLAPPPPAACRWPGRPSSAPPARRPRAAAGAAQRVVYRARAPPAARAPRPHLRRRPPCGEFDGARPRRWRRSAAPERLQAGQRLKPGRPPRQPRTTRAISLPPARSRASPGGRAADSARRGRGVDARRAAGAGRRVEQQLASTARARSGRASPAPGHSGTLSRRESEGGGPSASSRRLGFAAGAAARPDCIAIADR
jgi:hypothetical protein